MEMFKIDMLAGCASGVIAELEGAGGVPLGDGDGDVAEAARYGEELWPTDRSLTSSSSSAVRLELRGDVAPDDQRRTSTLAVIDGRLLKAASPERIRFLETMRRIVEKDGTLPRGGHKYHLRATLALAGVSFNAWVMQAGLREDVERICPLIGIGDVEATVHVRGGPRADSLLGAARALMDEMEASGETVARESLNAWRPSGNWFADRMGVPRSVFFRATSVKAELRRRVAAGRLKLGEPHFDPDAPSRAERRATRTVLKNLLLAYEKAGKPIPASSERSNKIDIDWLLDEAGIVDNRLRECMKCDQMFRHSLAECIRRVRLKPVHLARIDPRVVSYDRLQNDGLPLLFEIYRADTPKAVAGSDAEKAWVANQRSMLSRAMKAHGRGPSDDAAADMAGPEFEAMIEAGSTSSAKGNGAYALSLARWRRIAAALVDATAFPASFAGALDAAMVAARRNAPEIAATLGCNKQLIHTWRHGKGLPTYQNVHLIAPLEAYLGLLPNTLFKRLPRIRNSRTMYGGRKEVTLADGRVVQLSGLWRYMHPDAPTWPEDRLREHVEEAHERVFGRNTAHRVRQRTAMTNGYGLPEPDPISPIWKEFDDLIAFQTGVVDDGRLRHPMAEWRSDGTVKQHRGQITTWVRWLSLPVALGGAGIPPELISFTLILNYRLVLRYVTWRVLHGADLEVGGERIGPRITATEKMLLFFFSGLMDPEFGWLTQSRHVVQPPRVIATTFRMPFIRSAKDGVEITDDETCAEVEVASPELVAALATDRGWAEAAALANAHIRSTGSRFTKAFRLIRDPQQLVMPILRHQHPVAVGLRMVGQALDNARPISTSPHLHAVDVQRALAFLLLLIVVFRSQTMRGLTWRADGTGNVRKLVDGYEIVVEAESFKNCCNPELFGPSWNRRDYERSLGDWGGLNGVLDHYLEKCVRSYWRD